MNEDGLKLTSYFGERDRAHGRFVADALLDVFEVHRLRTSVLLRGTEGFGPRHRQSQRLLTLSEDLPLVAVAVDSVARIEAALADVAGLGAHGLVTLERARLLSGSLAGAGASASSDDETKLTVYCGRQERAGGRLAYRAVVDLLHRHGVRGATVLLGVDGTVNGARRRARFLGANAEVPLMIVAVGDQGHIAAALPALEQLLTEPLVTLERVQVCKRDGRSLGEPRALPEVDPSGIDLYQKLMVYAGEHTKHGGHALYLTLLHRLRREGAAGATAVRGLWGYHGDHEPHGDTVWSITRHSPIVTIIIDRPQRIRRWYEVVDELTPRTGLVTSEMVPALRPAARATEGGLARLG